MVSNRFEEYSKINNCQLKWKECPTANESNSEMGFLICTRQKFTLFNESTHAPLEETKILFIAHKARWKIVTLAFLAQIILAAAIQKSNYIFEKKKLFAWAYRFSRIIDDDDLALAKIERDLGIPSNPREEFEKMEWLEHFAAMQRFEKIN